MKFDFVVIGATGMQGRIVTMDLLASGYSVFLCGRDKSRVEHFLKKYPDKTAFEYVDLRNVKNTAKSIKKSGAKVMINCAEGDWDYEALLAAAEAGVHSLDLGSEIPITKKQLAMDKTLKKKNLIHITGCGSVPGIGNVMLRYAYDKFDKIESIDVGFAWDSNIKKFVVPFSMESVLEEFYIPADMIIHHRRVKLKPLDTVVRCYHKAIGKEKCFNVGHHPETLTFYKYCKPKGIDNVRFFAGFPDHSYNVIKTLLDIGFWADNPINFRGTKIWPDEFLTEMLKELKYPKGYTETENLWVDIIGKKNGKKKRILMECIVPPLKGWEWAGCNIDTGMPASIMAQMVYNKIITKPGSYSPEFIVPVEPFFKELRKRKMLVYENGKVIN